MRVFRSILIFFLASPALLLFAEENPQCQSKIFDRFTKTKKTGQNRPIRAPDEELREFMIEYEIICPWQVEVDFNNDRKRDWIGLVTKQGQTTLLAYISSLRGYQSYVVKQYKGFPRETHFSYMPTEEAALNSKKSLSGTNPPKFALIENRIGRPSTIYIWNGKAMALFDQFKGNY